MQNFNVFLICTLVFGVSVTFAANAVGSDLNDLKDKLQGVPGLENLPNSPNLEEAKNVLKKKCEQNGGSDAYAKLEVANENLKNCVSNLVNVTQMQEEIDVAKQTGSLDIVFGKYCKKIPEFDVCVKDYTDVMEICLDEKQKDGKKVFLNVTKSLSEFLCHKSGDRIAMFIAEGGVECLTYSQEKIQACANKTMGQQISKTNQTLNNAGVEGIADFNLDSLSILTFDEHECKDIKEVQDCIVKELQGCKDPTPSNIVESLFKFIIKMTPCQSMLTTTDAAKVKGKNSSTVHFVSGSVLLFSVIIASFRFV